MLLQAALDFLCLRHAEWVARARALQEEGLLDAAQPVPPPSSVEAVLRTSGEGPSVELPPAPPLRYIGPTQPDAPRDLGAAFAWAREHPREHEAKLFDRIAAERNETRHKIFATLARALGEVRPVPAERIAAAGDYHPSVVWRVVEGGTVELDGTVTPLEELVRPPLPEPE